MEETKSAGVAKPLSLESHFSRTLLVAGVLTLVLGTATGYLLSQKSPKAATSAAVTAAKSAGSDNQTFKDFAEGTIKPKSQDDNSYAEGTHILERNNAYPVALTSSVVDLSTYEGKKVKVYGETQKALSEGWLMDVGKVEAE